MLTAQIKNVVSATSAYITRDTIMVMPSITAATAMPSSLLISAKSYSLVALIALRFLVQLNNAERGLIA
jgi:hypothetical protein